MSNQVRYMCTIIVYVIKKYFQNLKELLFFVI